MALILALGCKDEPESEDTSPPESGGSNSGGSGSPLGMLAGGLDKPGPYEELQASPDFDASAEHFVVLELGGTVDELESISWLGTMGKPLREITQKIDAAARDEKVAGMVLRTSGLSIDLALAEELRLSLLAFKASGKPLECHTEGSANAGYFVLAACGRIGVAPLGDVMVTGAAATPIHVKGLLDSFGVQAQFLHVGAYKGAAEPLTRDAPSEQMLETLQAIVDRGWETLVTGIVEGRGLERTKAEAAVDEAIFVDEAALKAGLVDAVVPWEAFLAEATGGKPWTRLGGGKDEGIMGPLLAFQRFMGMLPPERPEGPRIALVYAVGNVIDGKGSGILGARQEIASRTLVATLDALAREDDVKAVVMRVSSPGGSALASEQIWHAVERLGKDKPVLVSMGAVAASGGYFISAGAKKIFADANTLTGSIGVVGGKIVYGDALAKFGVKSYEVHHGERAMMWSRMQPWSANEEAAVQALMETTYERFVAHVAAGRKKDRDAVHEVAQGRVWTGADALERGLVDAIGGLDDALAAARELAGVDKTAGVEVYPGDPTLRDIVSSLGMVQAGPAADATVTSTLNALDPAAAAEVQRQLRLLLDLRDTKLWAVSWVRPL